MAREKAAATMPAAWPLPQSPENARGTGADEALSGLARSFASQERVLIVLNMFALAALATVHIVFHHITDPFSLTLVLVLMAARFLEQGGELLWLRRYGAQLSEATAARWARFSIAANIMFTGVVSAAANSVDAHYTVLLIIPVIAAAFRLCFFHLLLTIGVAAGLSTLDIWIYFMRNPPIDVEEFFEVATEGLVFVVVGLVSWGLVSTMRRDASALERTLKILRHAQDRLVAEEKLAAVGRLSSAIAHEIRNPVGSIVSALETGRRPEVSEATRAEMHMLAATEAGRLEKLTTDFLTYARTRAPEPQTVSVSDTLNYVAGLMRARTGAAGPEVQVDCIGDFPLEADAYQLQQALINLGINAVDHTPAEGKVVIGARCEGAVIALHVENTGPAVREPSNLFEPFYTTRARGTGLGLAITRNIARAHGGDCTLSKNEDGAVRFTITLPAKDQTCRES